MHTVVHVSSWPAPLWARHGNVEAVGSAVRLSDGAALDAGALAAWMDGPPEAFRAKLRDLAGCWAVVRNPSSEQAPCQAAVDAVRSHPLFYASDGQLRYLSDDPEWLAQQLRATGLDPLAGLAFLLQGFVPGSGTLIEGVRQVQAGEMLESSDAGWQTIDFAGFPDPPSEAEPEALEPWVERGRAVLERVGSRLVHQVRGGTPVVPLSGGLDSRLVAWLLAEGGRMDTVCFSYGRPGSQEARTSRRVAARLGLRWHFVRYTNRAWSRTFRGEPYQEYRRFASRLAAIEHEQDWLAVHRLKGRSLLPADSVFVPGHSGDFLAGSHLPVPARDLAEANPVDWILARYASLWPTDGLDRASWSALRLSLARTLGAEDEAIAPAEALRLFDRYGWRERQAKLIVNSVRVYEHHGADWLLPLWDVEWMRFWSSVPIALRREKKLYRALLLSISESVFSLPTAAGPRRGWKEKLHRTLDLDYHRYGMFLGAFPALFGLRHPLGTLAGDIPLPALHQLVHPIRFLPPQTRPLNALIALFQLRDALRAWG